MFMCFFFNDTATTEIYTLSLHDALPIFVERNPSRTRDFRHSHKAGLWDRFQGSGRFREVVKPVATPTPVDRKSTRLNSSHANISYAVFCLKKKKNTHNNNDAIHNLLKYT